MSDARDSGRRSLLRELRARLRDRASGNVPLDAEELRALLDELSRLQQSNDRLRRQNRRVRLRLQRATGEAMPEDEPDADDGSAGEP